MKDKESTEIPLLEEVNELLEKERSLMKLKVIEQHVEANEWKNKYEILVKTIADDTLNPTKISAYEVAADISNAACVKSWRNNVEKQLYLLPKSTMPWYLDVSDTKLTSNDLQRILMYPKTNNYKKISAISFRNCCLDDSCAKLLPHLLRFPNIAAIDFSCNRMAGMFQSALLAAVEAKRLNLQYFLIHGNMEMSNFPLESMLHHVGSDMWGLTVSLTDVTMSATKAKPMTGAVTKAASNTPKHLARFLKHLNHVINPKKGQEQVGRTTAERKKNGANSKMTPQQRAKHNEFLQPHRGAGGAHAAPQAICVLGFMHSILCDESLVQLEKTTLQLTISSLTDLDLSYSFTGMKGAKVIGKALRHRSCQLIRLNLMGNSLGDGATASFLCPGLQTSQTLTYLDLKSNNLTDLGLSSLTNALSGKLTFRKLLLEGNRLSLAAVIAARSLVLKSGSPNVDVNFGVSLSAPSLVSTPANAPFASFGSTLVDEVSDAIFSIPGQVSAALDSFGGEALLYSIESQKIKTDFSSRESVVDDSDVMSVLEGKMAEASEGEVRVAWRMSMCDFVSGEHDSSIFQLFSKAVISWEVTCVSHTNQVTTLCSKTMLPDAFLPIGSSISCSATVAKPPFRTRLEISVKVVHSKAIKTTSKKLRVNAFGLRVFSIPVNFDGVHMLHSGDSAAWSAASNSLLAAQGDGGLGGGSVAPCAVPEGFDVARRVQFLGQHALDVRFCFRAKLSAVYDVSRNTGVDTDEDRVASTIDSTWRMAEGSTIGYSWCLCRCRQLSGTIIVASGEVCQFKSDHSDEGMGNDSSTSGYLLQPWLWRDQEVAVDEAVTNETFLLCVKMSSDPPVRDLKTKCKVQVSKCEFYVAGENYEKQKDIVYECQRNETISNSAFNSSAVEIFL